MKIICVMFVVIMLFVWGVFVTSKKEDKELIRKKFLNPIKFICICGIIVLGLSFAFKMLY